MNRNNLKELKERNPETKTYKAGIYGMTCTVDYEWIINEINEAYKELI